MSSFTFLGDERIISPLGGTDGILTRTRKGGRVQLWLSLSRRNGCQRTAPRACPKMEGVPTGGVSQLEAPGFCWGVQQGIAPFLDRVCGACQDVTARGMFMPPKSVSLSAQISPEWFGAAFREGSAKLPVGSGPRDTTPTCRWVLRAALGTSRAGGTGEEAAGRRRIAPMRGRPWRRRQAEVLRSGRREAERNRDRDRASVALELFARVSFVPGGIIAADGVPGPLAEGRGVVYAFLLASGDIWSNFNDKELAELRPAERAPSASSC